MAKLEKMLEHHDQSILPFKNYSKMQTSDLIWFGIQ